MHPHLKADLQKKLDVLNEALAAKGYKNPTCELNFDGRFWFLVKNADPDITIFVVVGEYTKRKTVEGAFERALDHIGSLDALSDA